MRKDNSNDDLLDLSEMIDEYEEDSELRRKIEAMKQAQKESDVQPDNDSVNETNDEPEIYSAFAYNDNADDNEAANESPVYEESDYDKTKVVMDHPHYEENEQAEESDSVYLYDNHEVAEEEITEDDINEFLGENKKDEKKPPMDPEKMNKIVTTVIIALVSICLLVGVGFGVKAMFFNSSDDPVTDTDKDKTDKDKDKDDDSDKPITVTPDDNTGTTTPDENDPPEKDNTKEIAEIKGKIEANTKQIDVYNQQIKEAQGDLKNNTIDENELYAKRTELDDTTRLIGNIAQELEDYKTKCSADDAESEFCAAFDEQAKKDEMTSLNSKLNTLKKEVGDLEKKKQAYDQANAKIAELNSEVTRLNNEISELQNKLSSLQ